MIDKETGAIHFPGWNDSLSRATMREQFLRSSLVQDANIQLKNGFYCAWRLKPTEWDDGKWWNVILYFEGDKLYQVILSASDHETDARWEDWSEELELCKRDYYSEVLTKLLGNERRFPWGGVEALYDGKSGGSCIIIKY